MVVFHPNWVQYKDDWDITEKQGSKKTKKE